MKLAVSELEMSGRRGGLNFERRVSKDNTVKNYHSSIRNLISAADGTRFPPEKGRYHLFVSYECSSAHAILIVRQLKDLEDIIPLSSVVHLNSTSKDCRFPLPGEALPEKNCIPNSLHPGVRDMRELYLMHDSRYLGPYTAPVLWDKKTGKIVNNDSGDIIRMLNSAFNHLLLQSFASLDLYPEHLEDRINRHDVWIYENISRGLETTGLTTTAIAREGVNMTVTALFEELVYENLDKAEAHLASSAQFGPFYFGAYLTEADVRLFVTVVRFDAVYAPNFRCHVREIRSAYPVIHRWLKYLYWNVPAFRETTEFEHVRKRYRLTSPLGGVAGSGLEDWEADL